MLNKVSLTVTFAIVLSACGHVDEYERYVTDWEPVYCYKSLAAMQCYREPKYADRFAPGELLRAPPEPL
jgi:hypothetical protein